MSRKILLISVSIILVIALGGYTAYWFMAANRLKSELIAEIDSLHAPISYESVSMGGFPFRVEASLNKFHASTDTLQIDCDRLALSKALLGSETKIGGVQTVTLSLPARLDRQAMKVNANIPDGVWVAWTQFENTSEFPKTEQDWEKFLKNIETIEYKIGRTSIVDSSSGKVLLEQSSGDLLVKVSAPLNNRSSVKVDFVAKDLEYKPEFDAWVKSLAGKSAPFFSSIGKHNYDGEVSASWPTSGEGLIAVDLTRLDYKSAHCSSHSQLGARIDTAQKAGSLTLSGNWTGGEELTGMMKKSIQDYLATQDKNPAVRDQIGLIRGIADVISELVQPEGKINLAVAVALTGQNAPRATLKTAEYKSGPYDISLKGEYVSSEPKKVVVHASLSNFKQLFDKLASKSSTPDLKDKLNELFDSISPETRGSKNLEISYSTDTGKIGALTLQEFLDKCTSLFGSVNRP